MIVVGVDPHKKTHTAVAVSSQIGELKGEVTVKARPEGHAKLIQWARALDEERVFALEDCRHVSGALERSLISRGERVVRVPPKLMGEARRSARSFGKSDSIDALAVARAALRESDLPEAHLDGPAREIQLLTDHREDLVAERTRIQNRLRWHLHDLDPALDEQAKRLERSHRRLDAIARSLVRLEQTAQVRVCRDLVRRLKALSRDVKALEAELGELVGRHAGALLELPGCGTLTAAKLVAEVAGVERFSSDAKLAKLAGVAPLDASSGKQQRHRLTARATVSSTALCIGSRSPRAACMLRRERSSLPNRPRERAGARHSAASSDTWPGWCSSSCGRSPRVPTPKVKTSSHQKRKDNCIHPLDPRVAWSLRLDIGATRCRRRMWRSCGDGSTCSTDETSKASSS